MISVKQIYLHRKFETSQSFFFDTNHQWHPQECDVHNTLHVQVKMKVNHHVKGTLCALYEWLRLQSGCTCTVVCGKYLAWEKKVVVVCNSGPAGPSEMAGACFLAPVSLLL